MLVGCSISVVASLCVDLRGLVAKWLVGLLIAAGFAVWCWC